MLKLRKTIKKPPTLIRVATSTEFIAYKKRKAVSTENILEELTFKNDVSTEVSSLSDMIFIKCEL